MASDILRELKRVASQLVRLSNVCSLTVTHIDDVVDLQSGGCTARRDRATMANFDAHCASHRPWDRGPVLTHPTRV